MLEVLSSRREHRLEDEDVVFEAAALSQGEGPRPQSVHVTPMSEDLSSRRQCRLRVRAPVFEATVLSARWARRLDVGVLIYGAVAWSSRRVRRPDAAVSRSMLLCLRRRRQP
jgi:hypothetical protein